MSRTRPLLAPSRNVLPWPAPMIVNVSFDAGALLPAFQFEIVKLLTW
jgi:hypothetical protein